MGLFRKRLPKNWELYLLSIQGVAEKDPQDEGCWWIYPPTAGLLGGATCGVPEEKHGPNVHPYLGPGSVLPRTCPRGHVYAVLAVEPDTRCQFCVAEEHWPGWRPRIGGWAKLPPDLQP